MAYAEDTTVPVEKSMLEIVALAKKCGAVRIGQIEEPDGFAIQFFLQERLLRFRVRFPSFEDMPDRDGRGEVSIASRNAKAQQARRQRARALLLVIKAKLESVESKVETFDEAFMANVVMPDGATVGEMALPRIAQAYADGKQPQFLLPAS